MVVRELVTKLGFSVDRGAINQAERGMMSLRKLALSVSAAFAGIKLYNFLNGIISAGDELKEISEQIGITTDALQKLQYSAKISGVDVESLRMGLGRFVRVLEGAQTGSKSAAEALAKVGIKDAKRFKTIEEALFAVADGASKIDNDMKVAAISQELFGRGGLRMAKFLRQGSDEIKKQGELLAAVGGILDKDMIDKADEFRDSMVLVRLAMRGLGSIVIAGLLPYLNELTSSFISWIKANRELIKIKIESWFKRVGAAIDAFAQVLGGLKDDGQIDYINAIDNALKGLAGTLLLLTSAKIVTSLLSLGRGVGFLLGARGLGKAATTAAGTAVKAGGGMAKAGLETFLAGAGGAIAVKAGGAAIGSVGAIAAAVAAVVGVAYLAIDDFTAFLEGRGSVLEIITRQASKAAAFIVKVFSGMWESPIESLKAFGAWILKQAVEIGAKIQNVFSSISTMFGKYFARMEEIRNEEFAKAGLNATDMLGRKPSVGAAIVGASKNENVVNVQSKIDVNVASNADPQEIAKAAGDKVRETWADVLRATKRYGEIGGY